jgi:hypothetical protein
MLPQLIRILLVLGAAFVGWRLAPKQWRVTGATLGGVLVALGTGTSLPDPGASSSWGWPLFVAALVLSPWYLVPLILYGRTLPLRPADPEPFELARHPISPAVDAWMRQAVEALAAEGFAGVDDVAARLPTNEVVTRWIIMDHASEATRAVLVGIGDGSPGRGNSLHFTTVLSDGRWLAAGNSPEPPMFPPLRKMVGAPFPDLRGAAELLAAFRAFARQTGGSQPRSLPPGADVGAALAENTRALEEEMLARGWFRRARDGVRLSPRAAFLTSWRQFFPFYQLRFAARRREQDRLLRSLGMAPPPRARDVSAMGRWLSRRAVPAAATALLALAMAWL